MVCVAALAGFMLYHWLATNVAYSYDAFTYWLGPRVLWSGHDPYVVRNLRDQLDVAQTELLIRNIPDGMAKEMHSYLAPPIDLLLYLPFSFISDYLTFLAVHWMACLVSLTAALWLWVPLLAKRHILRLLAAVCALIFLFLESPTLRWSLGIGQIDYLYFLPLSVFAYLFGRSQEEASRNKALGAGACLALAAFVKVFPGLVLVFLTVAYLVMPHRRDRGEERGARQHLGWVLSGSISFGGLLMIGTLVYPGYQSYLSWARMIQGNFVQVAYSHNLAHFISVILRDSPMAEIIFPAAYLVFLGIAWMFLFRRREPVNVLHISGIIAAFPTWCWFWQDYYYVVLVLPAVIAVSVVWESNGAMRQKIIRTLILIAVLTATQVISGSGQVYAALRLRLPATLANPLPGMQMEYWPQLLVYPSSLLLWWFIWRIQSRTSYNRWTLPLMNRANPLPQA